MAKIKGTVTGKGKGKYSYFVRLQGNEMYFNTKYEPKCNEGDTVGIEFEQKGPNRANIKKIVVLSEGSGGFEPPAPQKFGGSDSRQDSIVWQHSQEMGVRFLDTLVAAGALKLTGNPEAKRTVLTETLNELTVSFFKDALEPRKSAAFKTEEELEEDLDESPPEEDGEDDGWPEDDGWEN